MTMQKGWLPFTDDFIFTMVMRNPEICKTLLERILPNEEFSEIVLTSQEHPFFTEGYLTTDTQKSLKFDADMHGVRFDAFIKSENLWADVEMQTYSYEAIGKRSRYYHANMDMDFLESGNPYSNLKKSYVIFICTFDYKKQGKPIYVFQNYDVDNQIYFDDESYTIILNTTCPLDNVPERLKSLYSYINDALIPTDDKFIKDLDKQVQKYNTPEWRRKQMTLEHLIERERKITRDRDNQLTQLLIKAGRIDDLLKATTDPDFQNKLFEEFGI